MPSDETERFIRLDVEGDDDGTAMKRAGNSKAVGGVAKSSGVGNRKVRVQS